MEELNLSLFALINGSTGLSGFPLLLPVLIARHSWVLMLLLLVCVWDRGNDTDRGDVLLALGALALGGLFNFLIHSIHYLPRPEEMGIGNILMSHRFDARFPSNHGTGTLSVAFAFLFNRHWRKFGGALLGLALLTCWARVFLGVHMPFDMLVSVGVALLCTFLVRPASAPLVRVLAARISPSYDRLRSKQAGRPG